MFPTVVAGASCETYLGHLALAITVWTRYAKGGAHGLHTSNLAPRGYDACDRLPLPCA